MTTHIAFIRVKNVKSDSIDIRTPGDMPFQQFTIEESQIAAHVAAGYEVLDTFEYAQMILALTPEMEAYQAVLEADQKAREIEDKIKIRASISSDIIVAIVTYVESNLDDKVVRDFMLNPYTSPMFNQIRSMQFEIAIDYVRAHPLFNDAQKETVSKLITDKLSVL